MRILKRFANDVIRDPFGLADELAQHESEIPRDQHGHRLPTEELSDEEYAEFERMFDAAGKLHFRR